jgi:hypothetical protein
MNKNNTIGRLIVFILVGLIVGGILGEALGLVLGQIGVLSGGNIDNPMRSFFVKAWDLDMGFRDGWALDLYLVKVRFGLGFKFNTCSIVGMLASLYVMKWSRN